MKKICLIARQDILTPAGDRFHDDEGRRALDGIRNGREKEIADQADLMAMVNQLCLEFERENPGWRADHYAIRFEDGREIEVHPDAPAECDSPAAPVPAGDEAVLPSMDQIRQLAGSEEEMDRVDAAYYLVDAGSDREARELLKVLAADPSQAVRVDAIDSLSARADASCLPIFEGALHDPDYLVRGYGATGFAELYKKLGLDAAKGIAILRACNESDEWAQISFWYGEALLGAQEALPKILGAVSSSDYSCQCAALRSLEDLLPLYRREIGAFVRGLSCEGWTLPPKEALRELKESLSQLEKAPNRQ